MLPKTPFAQFVLPRLAKFRAHVKPFIWEAIELPDARIKALPASAKHRPFAAIAGADFQPISAYPHRWSPKFSQAWFQLELPRELLADYPYLEWRDLAESTLYVDGVPYAGYDPAHVYWKLPADFSTLHVEGACVRTGIWVKGGDARPLPEAGGELYRPRLARRNEDAWQAWIDLGLLDEWLRLVVARNGHDVGESFSSGRFMPPLYRLDPLARQVIHLANQAIDAGEKGDWAALRAGLTAALKAMPAHPSALQGTLTGHAHIDLVWLWPESTGEAKAVHTFASTLRLMELYPEFVFGYSQPASYRAVEARSPELMAQVRARLKEGRWEATGALEVESDTNLCCGEALIRSLLLGQEGFTELNGQPSQVLWLPDVFGYAGYVPQLLQEGGVDYFFTQKETWSNAQRFPYSSFRWKGIDGSEVLAHVAQSIKGMGYNGDTELEHMHDIGVTHQQAAIHPETLIPLGYGDGGGGCDEVVLERARRLADLAEMPRCQWGRIEDFYARMEPLRDRLPVWSGEIYLEYHRGVQTTHNRLKSAFRGLERALQVAEAAAVATGQPLDLLAHWRRMVFAQFHDFIPGSSVMEVYEEGVPELEARAQQAVESAEGLFKGQGEAAFFNPHAQALTVRGSEGDQAWALELPPLSVVPRRAAQTVPAEARPSATAQSLQNQRVQAQFDAEGCLSALVIDGQPVPLTGPAGRFYRFDDLPMAFPAWDIDRYTLSNGEPLTGAVEWEAPVIEPHCASLSYRRAIGLSSEARVTFTLEADLPVLQVAVELDWQEPQQLLKMAFPTAYRGRCARFGAGFGSVLREQLPGTLSQDSQFEVPASRWAAVMDDTESDGLGLVTEDKYGFGAWEGLLHLTLVRSPKISDTDQHPDIRELEYTEPFSDLHPHTIRFALGRHAADLPREEHLASLADTLYTPALPVGAPASTGPLEGLVGGESLIPAWVKPAADGRGWILRLHEVLGQRGTFGLQLAEGWVVERVNVREQILASVPDPAAIPYQPYRFLSFRLALAS